MTTPTEITVGTVFVESWGYDQTNIDTYVVVRTTSSSVFLKPCGQEIVSGRVQPRPDNVQEFRTQGTNRTRIGKTNSRGEVRKATPKSGWNGEPWLSLTSYSGASVWDGERTYHDTIAAGLPGH